MVCEIFVPTQLDPDKTRPVRIWALRRCESETVWSGQADKPETFDFPGFINICGRSWKKGEFLVLRKTVLKCLLNEAPRAAESALAIWGDSGSGPGDAPRQTLLERTWRR